MIYAPAPTPAPKPKSRRWLIVSLATFTVIVACFTGLMFIGATLPDPPVPGSTSPARVAFGAAPTPAKAPTTPRATPTTPRPAATRTPTADKANWAAVAAAGKAASQHYRKQISDGQAAFDTPAFAPWWQAATNDLTCETTRAHAIPDIGDDDPAPLETWYSDCINVSTDANEWARAALMAEPGARTAEMVSLVASINRDLTTVDRDVAAFPKG